MNDWSSREPATIVPLLDDELASFSAPEAVLVNAPVLRLIEGAAS
jgi:hypothetical protein